MANSEIILIPFAILGIAAGIIFTAQLVAFRRPMVREEIRTAFDSIEGSELLCEPVRTMSFIGSLIPVWADVYLRRDGFVLTPGLWLLTGVPIHFTDIDSVKIISLFGSGIEIRHHSSIVRSPIVIFLDQGSRIHKILCEKVTRAEREYRAWSR